MVAEAVEILTVAEVIAEEAAEVVITAGTAGKVMKIGKGLAKFGKMT